MLDAEPVDLPKYPDWVFAVAMPSRDQATLGVVYLARTRGIERSIIICDYDLAAVTAQLFADFLPGVFERLEALAEQCDTTLVSDAGTRHAGLWVQDEGIGTTLLQHGRRRGLLISNIDESLELPSELGERVNDVSGLIHAGRVKISRRAHERLLTHQGVTRNHFMSQFTAYRVGSEDEESLELLSALCAGIVIADPGEVRRKKLRARHSHRR